MSTRRFGQPVEHADAGDRTSSYPSSWGLPPDDPTNREHWAKAHMSDDARRTGGRLPADDYERNYGATGLISRMTRRPAPRTGAEALAALRGRLLPTPRNGRQAMVAIRRRIG